LTQSDAKAESEAVYLRSRQIINLNRMRDEKKKDKLSYWYGLLQYSSIGLEMGFSVAVGALIGTWLDNKLGTYPWMVAFWSLCGLLAGFRSLFRMVKKYLHNIKNKNQNESSE
jgi:ATP synthase protein I